MFHGSCTALITPFRDGKIDGDAFQKFVDWQITEGTNGLVPVGTTGESPTLTHEEHGHVVELCIAASAGRVPVMAGAGSNSTREAISLALHAEKAGADSVLVVTPYYNKPTQDGLYLHFSMIAEAVSLPIYIYNIPGRSIVDMSVETMARLYETYPNIVGVKDATTNMVRASAQRQAMGPEFIQLSGEDATAMGFNAHGGTGCISVVSNIAPKLCAAFQATMTDGDFAKARAYQDRLFPLQTGLFAEASPGPVKYAAEVLGHCTAETRPPLAPINDDTKSLVRDALHHAGLLN